MNLRKLSQQSYFKTKPRTCTKGDVIEEEEHVNTKQKHKKNVSQHSTSPQSNQTQSQLFQKFKTYISSTSPNQKYTTKAKISVNSVSQFTTDTKAKQSTTEQEEVVQRLFNWEKKRQQELEKQQKQLEMKEKQNLRDKPKLTKETKKICENGLKHHFQLCNFIKFRHSQTQCSGDCKPLIKLERLQKGTKIIIEIENDENLDDENNKSTQYNYVAKEQVENQCIVNKEYRSKSDICNMPIHLRYEYEIQFKEAKLAQMRDQKQQQFEDQLQQLQKYNSTAEQFEHFLSEQENFLKRKQQFQTEQFKKQLDQIQELESLNTFSPVINFPPLAKKEEKTSSKDEKFNQKLSNIEEPKSKQKNFYFFRSTLPDVRKSIKKKYDEILHKSDIANHNQFETERL